MLRTTKSCKEALVLLRCLFISLFFHVFSNVCQTKVGFNHLLTLHWLLHRFQMNSILFLVTASILFHSVWESKFSSGWIIWWNLSVMAHANCKSDSSITEVTNVWIVLYICHKLDIARRLVIGLCANYKFTICCPENVILLWSCNTESNIRLVQHFL